MPARSFRCPECDDAVDYWKAYCRCGRFIGFPNHRQALAEQDELSRRYDAARVDAHCRHVGGLLSDLEGVAERSRPVIAMSFAACDDILRPGKYRNYDQRVDSGERAPADEQDHADRTMVGVRLFPKYQQHMCYAALSPDGRGLSSYGPVAMRWQVTPVYLGRRASLLDENSFTFYDHHRLGDRGARVPQGHRAIWDDRAKLTGAKLAASLTPATSADDLPDLLFRPGAPRADDQFVEIAIYADGGLDTQDVDQVMVLRRPDTADERRKWESIRQSCGSREPAIDVIG